jgi:hypothetical protein
VCADADYPIENEVEVLQRGTQRCDSTARSHEGAGTRFVASVVKPVGLNLNAASLQLGAREKGVASVVPRTDEDRELRAAYCARSLV